LALLSFETNPCGLKVKAAFRQNRDRANRFRLTIFPFSGNHPDVLPQRFAASPFYLEGTEYDSVSRFLTLWDEHGLLWSPLPLRLAPDPSVAFRNTRCLRMDTIPLYVTSVSLKVSYHSLSQSFLPTVSPLQPVLDLVDTIPFWVLIVSRPLGLPLFFSDFPLI